MKISQRRRRILIATGGLVLMVSSAAFIFWPNGNREAQYTAGEAVGGLTAHLSRALPEDHPRIIYTDATVEAGIGFRHFSGRRSSQLPEDMGSGAAWGDYDNDGWLDLFVVNQAGPITMTEAEMRNSPAHSALYHNNGDGTFTEVSAAAGVDLRAWGMGAAWGDYDNDGWLDLFVSCYGENLFYRNNGDGTFTDATAQTGLGGLDGFWTGVSWADYNRDGYLDLYVCGYVSYSSDMVLNMSSQYDVDIPTSLNPSSFAPDRNLLYLNNGNGSFSEVGAKAKVQNVAGRSLSAAWCDFDNDGWPDLYVANDVSDNAFYRNLGNGTFEEIGLTAWVADYRGAMGLAVGDWDGDTDMDIFVTHWMAQENALYSNMLAQLTTLGGGLGGIKFMDVAERFGLGQIALDYIGWGTSFLDYDNDGRLDLFVVNGSTFQQSDASHLLLPMKSQLFWNRSSTDGFYDVSAVSGPALGEARVGRGAAFADYDNDGDVDIFIVANDGPGLLLRNDGGNSANWLAVSLQGRSGNRQGIGARLRLVAGGSVQVRQVGAQSSYLSQNSTVEHFGLAAVLKADTLEVVWPSGVRQVLVDVPVNQRVHLLERTPER